VKMWIVVLWIVAPCRWLPPFQRNILLSSWGRRYGLKMEVVYFFEALEPPKRLHGVTVQKIQKSQLYVVFALHGNRWLYFNICKLHSSYTSAHKGDCFVRLCFSVAYFCYLADMVKEFLCESELYSLWVCYSLTLSS
jgi:hypothetical protein